MTGGVSRGGIQRERWQQVERIYVAAAGLNAGDRAAYLDQACAGDATLRSEVESLLGVNAASFLEATAADVTARILAREAPRLQPGHALGSGAYELVEPIGAGGMGEVWRARDVALKRDVAVKVLLGTWSHDPERLRRFEQEARAAGMVNHPNLLGVYAVGREQGTPYLVTELLEGETLRHRLNSGALPLRKAIACAAEVARGLAAAHEKGIAHRDIKPENIFLTRDGRVKILDFGLAKLRESVLSDLETATASGVVLGSPGYMSPEQARGQQADHRADLFAFGAVLYEMLSGRRAFHRDTPVETMAAIVKEDPPPLGRCAAASDADRAALPGEEPGGDVSVCSRSRVSARGGAGADGRPAGRARAHLAAAARPGGRRRGTGCRGRVVLGRAADCASDDAAYPALTFGRGNVSAARFAPDGHTILYSARWDGNRPEVFSTRTDSIESRSIITDAELLSVSGDGQMALLLRTRPVNPFARLGTVASMAIAGGAPREIAENSGGADWHPAGGRLALVRNLGALEFPPSTRLASGGFIRHLRFSRDGERLAVLESLPDRGIAGSVVVFNIREKRKVLVSEVGSRYGDSRGHPEATRSGSAAAGADTAGASTLSR